MKTLLGILGCGFFLFITLNRLSHSLLICTVSAEITLKPLIALWRLLLYVICCFFKFIFYCVGCWVFTVACGLSLFEASGGYSPVAVCGLLLLWSTGSRLRASAVVAHSFSCSAACGIFPDQDWNPCPLHWQADSQSLDPWEAQAACLLMGGWGCVPRVGCLAWDFLALEPAGCWVGPGLGAEMGTSRGAHTNHYSLEPEPQPVGCSHSGPPQETL